MELDVDIMTFGRIIIVRLIDLFVVASVKNAAINASDSRYKR